MCAGELATARNEARVALESAMKSQAATEQALQQLAATKGERCPLFLPLTDTREGSNATATPVPVLICNVVVATGELHEARKQMRLSQQTGADMGKRLLVVQSELDVARQTVSSLKAKGEASGAQLDKRAEALCDELREQLSRERKTSEDLRVELSRERQMVRDFGSQMYQEKGILEEERMVAGGLREENQAIREELRAVRDEFCLCSEARASIEADLVESRHQLRELCADRQESLAQSEAREHHMEQRCREASHKAATAEEEITALRARLEVMESSQLAQMDIVQQRMNEMLGLIPEAYSPAPMPHLMQPSPPALPLSPVVVHHHHPGGPNMSGVVEYSPSLQGTSTYQPFQVSSHPGIATGATTDSRASGAAATTHQVVHNVTHQEIPLQISVPQAGGGEELVQLRITVDDGGGGQPSVTVLEGPPA